MAENELHKFHRLRIRGKYEKYGADIFEKHQLMEMLLFHSIKRGDTNALAHKVLNAHPNGGLGTTSPSVLTDVAGVGENTANLLSISADTTVALLMDKLKREPLSSEFSQMMYMWLWFANKSEKTVGALFLDEKWRFVDCVCLAKGKLLRPEAYLEDLTEAIQRNSTGNSSVAFVVVAHNHWKGDKRPSAEDIYLTGYLSKGLEKNGVCLSAHYIVTGNDCIKCENDK